MFDNKTGEMVPIPEGMLKNHLNETGGNYFQAIQNAKDEVMPDRHRQGPVFQAGEVLIIRGVKFKIDNIVQEGMFLRGLPTKGC